MHRNDAVSLYLSFIQNVARIEVWLLSNYTVEFAFGIFGGISRSFNSLDFRCQTVPCNVNLHACELWSSVPVLLKNVYNFF